MLSSEDISAYFKALPRNFIIEINGVEYKCNKFCLASFSTVFSNIYKQNNNNSSIAFDDLLPDVSNDKIKTVLEFIHGQESFDQRKMSSFNDIFDYYYIAASLGISTIKNRLCNQLTNLITSDNVDFVYKKLSTFPDFYEPITRFYDNNNISLLNNFIESNIFSNNDNNCSYTFLHSFLENSTNTFPNEGCKLDLIRSVYNKTKSKESQLLYNCIHPDKLDRETLMNTLTTITIEEGRYMKCFKLISMLINEKIKTLETLKREKNKLYQLNNDLQEEKNKHSNHRSLASLSSNRISLALTTESQIKQDINDTTEQLDLIAADIALIPVQNQTTIRFLENIDKMNDISKELKTLFQSFYDNLGWMLWPGSSVSTMNDAKGMADLMTELEDIVEAFKFDKDILGVNSQIFVSASDILRNALL